MISANTKPMDITQQSLRSVKRFYFLEYFYILFKSISRYSDRETIFDSYRILKEEHRLGESKYKKLTHKTENLTKVQMDRYKYTFEQVIEEAKGYGLITEQDARGSLTLTAEGKRLLNIFEEDGPIPFNQDLAKFMETKYNAFQHLITFLYNANRHKFGLLILPTYSPRKLGFERAEVKTAAHMIEYSQVLVQRLEQDIQEYLGQTRYLTADNHTLLERLMESGVLPRSRDTEFDPKKYNVITKRFRDFWITYFLKRIYEYEYSMSTFDIWTYRGKQIGIVQATEFYPGFNGKLVYPTSVLVKSTESKDFENIYRYSDGYGLYVHKPEIEANQDKFIDYLVQAYLDLRRTYRSYFINLATLREIVCYNMRMSEHLFQAFLENAYRLNLAGELKIRISLEVDRLPEETKAMYLKREPVMVDGRYRNIIAIDIGKEEKRYG